MWAHSQREHGSISVSQIDPSLSYVGVNAPYIIYMLDQEMLVVLDKFLAIFYKTIVQKAIQKLAVRALSGLYNWHSASPHPIEDYCSFFKL